MVYRTPTNLADALQVIELQGGDIRSLMEQLSTERQISAQYKEDAEALLIRLHGVQVALSGIGVFVQKVLGQHTEHAPAVWAQYIAKGGDELITEIRKWVAVEVDLRQPEKRPRRGKGKRHD